MYISIRMSLSMSADGWTTSICIEKIKIKEHSYWIERKYYCELWHILLIDQLVQC